MKKAFSEKFESNANLQLRKLNRAIDLYTRNVYEKSKSIRFVSKTNGFRMMQPLALKNFSDIAFCYLENVVEVKAVSMFTIVVNKYDFGQNNWNFQYKIFQKEIKKILNGFDYIANVALDEFPRNNYREDGVLMTPHIHGIFLQPLTRWEKSQISKKIKKVFPESRIRPFVVRTQFDLESALQYTCKALFGGKRTYLKKNRATTCLNMEITYKSIYTIFAHLKHYKIYDFAFAGGKGKKILEKIIHDIENPQN